MQHTADVYTSTLNCLQRYNSISFLQAKKICTNSITSFKVKCYIDVREKSRKTSVETIDFMQLMDICEQGGGAT